MELWGDNYPEREILRRIGRWEQICGIKRYQIREGKGEGLEIAQFYTTGGLELEVILSRGMDIGRAVYKGIPLCWISSSGYVHPSYYIPGGFGWLRSFGGGLLTTCGLYHAGPPAREEIEEIGLHGRVSHIPAERICLVQEWRDSALYLEARGEIRETRIFGENLLLKRKIWMRGDDKRVFIEDVVKNEGFQPTPHMILYHINIGFPLISKYSYLEGEIEEVIPRDREAEEGKEEYHRFSEPIPSFKEKCYFLKVKEKGKGKARVSIINPRLGIKVYVEYSKSTLPYFVEWKMMGEGDYVVGLEPANTLILPREELKKKGLLPHLSPQEEVVYHLEIGIEDMGRKDEPEN